MNIMNLQNNGQYNWDDCKNPISPTDAQSGPQGMLDMWIFYICDPSLLEKHDEFLYKDSNGLITPVTLTWGNNELFADIPWLGGLLTLSEILVPNSFLETFTDTYCTLFGSEWDPNYGNNFIEDILGNPPVDINKPEFPDIFFQ